MPHDRDGNVLEAGDFVNVPCVVTVVHTGDEHCNVSLETQYPMPPYSTPSNLSLNTKQVVKVHK